MPTPVERTAWNHIPKAKVSTYCRMSGRSSPGTLIQPIHRSALQNHAAARRAALGTVRSSESAAKRPARAPSSRPTLLETVVVAAMPKESQRTAKTLTRGRDTPSAPSGSVPSRLTK